LEIHGNTNGLAPSELNALERIYRRKVPFDRLLTPELTRSICEVSFSTSRQVGVLVDRGGVVEFVIVGDATKLWLPDFGRLRAAQGRFRGLRLIHTHLRGEPLTHDDLTDLALLRLDLVAAIVVEGGGRAGVVHVGHLMPENSEGELWRVLPGKPASQLGIDVLAFMRALEEEFARKTDRPAETASGDKAIVIHVGLGRARGSTEGRIAELRELCRTAGINVLDVVQQFRPEADPRYLVGKGKLEELVLRAMQVGADMLIFDPDLSPGQARAIAQETELKVIDRTMLILDIFAQHAKSRDGKLQVELAQLRYSLPRLAEKHTMMSRLSGAGAGGFIARGPGETKLEIERRRAKDKINRLEKQIEELADKRRLRRAARDKSDVPIVSIVGYTNAGKSTLLNALTRSDVVAEDKLFATLDPTSRRLRFPHEREVVITDTVGFIRDLPKDLQRAFRATLEELDQADLLVHVVDAADEDREQQIEAVNRILHDLGLAEKPSLLVFNKIDRLPPGEGALRAAQSNAVPISALDPATFTALLARLENELWKEGHAVALARPAAVTSSASP
jgi:GTP-binding protein HflX